MKFERILREMAADSANTSRNQIARGLKKLVSLGWLDEGEINLDYGGGKFEKGTQYMKERGYINLVYDPFSRSTKHNKDVLNKINKNDGADAVTLLNVLNVIPDKKERLDVVKHALRLLKPSRKMLVQCYNADSSGETKKTKDGWQLNQPISFYKDELSELSLQIKTDKDYLIISK